MGKKVFKFKHCRKESGKMFFILLLISLAVVASCERNNSSTEAPEEVSLINTKWKLVGIVENDVLKVMEPQDCSDCYTITFDTDSTFKGQLADNKMFGYYEIDCKTKVLHFTEIAVTQMISIWEKSEILYWQILREIQFFTVEDTHPRILYLYYNDNKNYLKYKEIGYNFDNDRWKLKCIEEIE